MAEQTTLLYVGTYTQREGHVPDGKGEGIYVLRLNTADGKLSPAWDGKSVIPATECGTNPTYFCAHPSKRVLYSVCETHPETSYVYSFAINDQGNLKFLNKQSTSGTSGCHISTDSSGRFLFVANYSSGNIAVFPINEDGSINSASDIKEHSGSSINKDRQQSPHPHAVVFEDGFVFVPDLGIDKVITYKFDAQNGKLTQHSSLDIEKGSGPRHFVFHPSKKYAYVVNELACTVTVCSYDASQSSLSTIQTVSTLPNGFSGNASCSAIRISKDGTALFVANRFQDSISVFSVDENGKIELKHNQPVGKTPRDFTVDPSERVLLVGNQDSHSISTFKINLKEFTLTPLSDYSLSSPACIFFY